MHCTNFDRIVIGTHWTNPIKVGATVGIAFLHTKPDDESRKEALPFSHGVRGKRSKERLSQEIIHFGINSLSSLKVCLLKVRFKATRKSPQTLPSPPRHPNSHPKPIKPKPTKHQAHHPWGPRPWHYFTPPYTIQTTITLLPCIPHTFDTKSTLPHSHHLSTNNSNLLPHTIDTKSILSSIFNKETPLTSPFNK